MIHIPLDVDVFCEDGRCGRTTNIIFNPVTKEATHLVVAHSARPNTEYLVPVRFLGESTPSSVNLRLSTSGLLSLEPFVQKEFVTFQAPQYRSSSLAWPVATSKTKTKVVVRRRIPLGEMAVRRGAVVEASDGRVGQVENFVVDEECRVTHLVLGKSNLWGHKDIAIPVTEVESYGAQAVRLTLDKQGVEALPIIEIHH
jgi:sporulation protein YlmC with PRC-barrel domain